MNIRGSDIITLKRALKEVWTDQSASFVACNEIRQGLSVAVCTYQRPASLLQFLHSIELQNLRPNQLLIVDASPGPDSETLVLQAEAFSKWADQVVYVRVAGELRGLTRQRNLALCLADRDHIAFFDDDVVLHHDCLSAMVQATEAQPEVVGVGAVVTNESSEPGWRWRLLRAFGAVPDLVPGRYHRSGFSIPLRLLMKPEGQFEVDRLQGCCMLWRTAVARELGFAKLFIGYSQSEDVEFSRRAARHGLLVVCADAKLEHHHCPAGRPDASMLARMGIMNRYYIQRTTLPDYSWSDVARFWYANLVYTTILAADYFRRGCFADFLGHGLGSVMGAVDACSWKLARDKESHRQKT